MGYIKVVKDNAYFKRYQTKFRRRREGKTDYYARRRLISQAKNKYGTPKYRVVVRITSRDIVGQVVTAKIQGDEVLCSAYAHELKEYGVKHGLTNWTAAYATGFLLARRTLAKIGLDSTYPVRDIHDESYTPEDSDRNPFVAYLDIGLKPATTGARVFGFLKGACDGGISIPHSDSRFVGYSDSTLDVEKLRSYVYGEHVSDYMNYLEEEDEESYKRQFASYIKDNVTADSLHDIYESCYKRIAENPLITRPKKKIAKDAVHASKKYHRTKMNNKQRKDRIRQKIASFNEKQESKMQVDA